MEQRRNQPHLTRRTLIAGAAAVAAAGAIELRNVRAAHASLRYGIPPGNPTRVWDDVEGVPGTVTSDPYVSWQYHLDRTNGQRGGVDMTAVYGTPLYAPIDCRVEHYGGGAGIAVRMWSADNSGWSDVFDHLSSIAVSNGASVAYGGLVGYSGDTWGYPAHLHWHRLDPGGVRRNPWNYFTEGAPAQIPDPFSIVRRNNSMSSLYYKTEGGTVFALAGDGRGDAAWLETSVQSLANQWAAQHGNAALLNAGTFATFKAAYLSAEPTV